MSVSLTRQEMQTRVARGAARFDEHDPNWAFRVNPDTVVMMYVKECVLGQYFGDFRRGLEELNLTLDTTSGEYTTEHDVVQLGFDLAHDEVCDENHEYTDDGNELYRLLTNLWRVAVSERRRRGVIPVGRTIT